MSSFPTSLTSNTNKEKPLRGESIAILIANGFNEDEMTKTQRALLETGATVKIVSVEQGVAHGWHENGWGHYFAVDEQLSEALSADYSMLLIPGGQRSLDKLKGNAHTTRFLRGFMSLGKPVALYGDAVQMLVSMDQASGKTVTGPAEQEAALVQAGATWSEDAVVTSENVLTGRVTPESMLGLVMATVAHFLAIPAELRMAA